MHTIMKPTLRSIVAGLWIVAVLSAAPVLAQDTREAEWTAEQQRKAAAAKPYVPSAAEQWLSIFRTKLLEQPAGFYPYFGSVYSGGGFTLGAGYRTYLADRTHADIKGLYSFKGYNSLELSTDSWSHADGRLDLHARLGWRDATQVAYYGLGIDSPNERSNFRMQHWYVGGAAELRPAGPAVLGGAV